MATAKKNNVNAKISAKKGAPAKASPAKAAKPAAKASPAKKNAKPAAKAPAKAPAKPAASKKPAAKPVAKAVAKSVAKPVAKPAAKSVASKKPAAKPAAKPAVKPAAKPAAKSAAKPAAPKPAPKPVAKPAQKKSGARFGLPLPPPPPPPPKSMVIRQQALTKEQVGAFKVRLAVELDFIKGNLNALTRDALRQQSESAGDVGIHSTHMADHGTDNFDRDINLLLASGRQEAIYAIEDALRRIEAGNFGDCEVCGNPIGFDRLNAMPYAKMCVECKKDMEKGRGRPMFKPYSREASIQGPQGDAENGGDGESSGIDTE